MYRKSSGLSLSTNVESPTIMFSCDGFNVTALARFTQPLNGLSPQYIPGGRFPTFHRPPTIATHEIPRTRPNLSLSLIRLSGKLTYLFT